MQIIHLILQVVVAEVSEDVEVSEVVAEVFVHFDLHIQITLLNPTNFFIFFIPFALGPRGGGGKKCTKN